MSYLYIDESGDLGFSKKGSEYFILSCVKIDDDETNKIFNRIPKKIRFNIFHKRIKKQAELKFSNSSEEIKCKFLHSVAKLDIEIFAIIIEKKFTDANLRDNLPILYNYLLKILLESPLNKLGSNKHLKICLDRCMSIKQRENFEDYIKTEFFSIFQKIPNLTISHEPSQNNCGLQVIDFICGAFGYKYNTAYLGNDCERYVDIIKPKIRLEKNDLFKKK